MAQDLKLKRYGQGLYDLQVAGNDFDTVDGFETAIIVSLMTDARAPESIVGEPLRRRGWVGDAATIGTGRKLGSLLWTFDQCRLTPEIVIAIEEASRDALQWMLDDRIARSVVVSAQQSGPREVDIFVDIDADGTGSGKYSLKWRSTDAI